MLPDVSSGWPSRSNAMFITGRPACGLNTSHPLKLPFCRITMLGFLRLSQNEAAFPGEAVTAEGAWSLYQTLCSDERVRFCEEPAGIDDLLGGHFSGLKKPFPKSVTDAYLAASARLSGLSLYTFDKALQKHPLLK